MIKNSMEKRIPIAIAIIGGTILMIGLVKAKPSPEEELVLPEYPVSRAMFIQNKLTELASKELNIPQTELNYMWT